MGTAVIGVAPTRSTVVPTSALISDDLLALMRPKIAGNDLRSGRLRGTAGQCRLQTGYLPSYDRLTAASQGTDARIGVSRDESARAAETFSWHTSYEVASLQRPARDSTKDRFELKAKPVSVHYFKSPTGRVFGVKVKPGWSN